MIVEAAKAEHSNFDEIYFFMNNRCWNVVVWIHHQNQMVLEEASNYLGTR